MRTHGGTLALSVCLIGGSVQAASGQIASHSDIVAADIARGFHDHALVVRLADGFSIQSNMEVVCDASVDDGIVADALEHTLHAVGAHELRQVVARLRSQTQFWPTLSV